MAGILGRPCVIPEIQRSEPAKNTSAAKYEQQRERETEIHRATTKATTNEQKQKTNDDKQQTTTAAPLSIVVAPVFFDW